MKRETINFAADDGENRDFFVEEETRIGGVDYILVSDSDDDEANAYILKDLSADGDTEAKYVMVTDSVELDAVSRIFAEMLEDVDFRKE